MPFSLPRGKITVVRPAAATFAKVPPMAEMAPFAPMVPLIAMPQGTGCPIPSKTRAAKTESPPEGPVLETEFG
uniref:Uncharacterized protein n=1 Tax=Globodera rostochiensis TaxID=31243 RepID=A0A914HAI8_GLORO